MAKRHKPVLLKESIDYLNIRKGKSYVDATVGGGGHTLAILKKSGRILGIDYDPEAIEAARRHLSQACPPVKAVKSPDGSCVSWRLVQGNFARLEKIVGKEGWGTVDGILFDLGVSSFQLDDPERGFSFESSAPLDMRMDPELRVTAADLVNGLNKGELSELFFKLAEEKYSRRLAAVLVGARRVKPIKTCRDLTEVVIGVKKKGRSPAGRAGKHPATQVFQALRIAVNDELNNLKKALPQAVKILNPKGRLVLISFHSGEDRIVKQFFKKTEDEGLLKVLTKKPVRPSREEVIQNPRSRSAKLRAAEKR